MHSCTMHHAAWVLTCMLGPLWGSWWRAQADLPMHLLVSWHLLVPHCLQRPHQACCWRQQRLLPAMLCHLLLLRDGAAQTLAAGAALMLVLLQVCLHHRNASCARQHDLSAQVGGYRYRLIEMDGRALAVAPSAGQQLQSALRQTDAAFADCCAAQRCCLLLMVRVQYDLRGMLSCTRYHDE